MLKRKVSPIKGDRKYILPVIMITFSFFFVVLDNVGTLNFLRSGVSIVFEPISYISNKAGDSVSKYFDTFIRFSEYNKEFNDMKIALLENEIENSSYSLLVEENESLKKQLEIQEEDGRYVLAKTLSDDDVNVLRINKGLDDGVKEGSVVSFGNMFVGLIAEADSRGSLVKLPTSKSSYLEVIVLKSNDFNDNARNILSRGVVVGASEGIRIENIPMGANVEDGDIVVVSDSKVGNYLVLGSLVSLSQNPAATSQFGYVSPFADYDGLMTVFVSID
jgi:cell shape-determining protein MreC